MKDKNCLKNYKDTKGVITCKRKSFLGKHILYIKDDTGKTIKVEVGSVIYNSFELNSNIMVGHFRKKVVNLIKEVPPQL